MKKIFVVACLLMASLNCFAGPNNSKDFTISVLTADGKPVNGVAYLVHLKATYNYKQVPQCDPKQNNCIYDNDEVITAHFSGQTDSNGLAKVKIAEDQWFHPLNYPDVSGPGYELKVNDRSVLLDAGAGFWIPECTTANYFSGLGVAPESNAQFPPYQNTELWDLTPIAREYRVESLPAQVTLHLAMTTNELNAAIEKQRAVCVEASKHSWTCKATCTGSSLNDEDKRFSFGEITTSGRFLCEANSLYQTCNKMTKAKFGEVGYVGVDPIKGFNTPSWSDSCVFQ